MNPRLFDVALKRERLIERIGSQRQRLANGSDGIRRLCTAGDRAVAAGRRLRDHPQWLLLAALALVVLRPRRAWRLAKTGLVLWRLWSVIRRRLPGLAAQ